ncbi:unnamed protein product [Didymodactylos carnosus]|uniref:Uncharacterized protein n=1 Tax=Didymodactylos carnosus TaxID=1234261 RepID=A0A816CYZ0_9BILA|nr:unnamed protein product [Didymodactylos carnosus]CAF4527017.1 unnamed protein product [Didymodactylos carnosus]
MFDISSNKRLNQTVLSSYFSKKQKQGDPCIDNVSTEKKNDVPLTTSDIIKDSGNDGLIRLIHNINPEKIPHIENDVGLHIGKRIDDETRYRLLSKHFTPSSNFVWPYPERQSKNRTEKRYLRAEHLTKYKWMKYSPSKRGLFCVPCALLAASSSGSLGMFVTTPCDSYTRQVSLHFLAVSFVYALVYYRLFDVTGYVGVHESNRYHQKSLADAENFLQTYENPLISIQI